MLPCGDPNRIMVLYVVRKYLVSGTVVRSVGGVPIGLSYMTTPPPANRFSRTLVEPLAAEVHTGTITCSANVEVRGKLREEFVQSRGLVAQARMATMTAMTMR